MYRAYQNQGQELINLGITTFDTCRLYNTPFMKLDVTDFSGTVKAVKLKLGTHMDNGLMYRVYQKQDQELITLGVTSLDRFYNLHQ